MSVHIQAIHNKKKYPCTICGAQLSSKFRMEDHMQRKHINPKNPKTNKKSVSTLNDRRKNIHELSQVSSLHVKSCGRS